MRAQLAAFVFQITLPDTLRALHAGFEDGFDLAAEAEMFNIEFNILAAIAAAGGRPASRPVYAVVIGAASGRAILPEQSEQVIAGRAEACEHLASLGRGIAIRMPKHRQAPEGFLDVLGGVAGTDSEQFPCLACFHSVIFPAGRHRERISSMGWLSMNRLKLIQCLQKRKATANRFRRPRDWTNS
jgi:hypothetical protein